MLICQWIVCFCIIILKIIYLFLAGLGLYCCMRRPFSSCGEWTLLCYSWLQCVGLSLQWLPCSRDGLQLYTSAGAAAGSRLRVQQLWRVGLVPLWHVEFPWTRNQTSVSFFGRQILIHCTTEGNPCFCIIFKNLIIFCEPTIRTKVNPQ